MGSRDAMDTLASFQVFFGEERTQEQVQVQVQVQGGRSCPSSVPSPPLTPVSATADVSAASSEEDDIHIVLRSVQVTLECMVCELTCDGGTPQERRFRRRAMAFSAARALRSESC